MGGSGAFVFGQLTGLRAGDQLRFVVGTGGVAGGAAGGPLYGAGGRGTGDGGASGGGYTSIELRRATGPRTWRRVIVAAGGGGAGGVRGWHASGGAGGLTDGFRGGAGTQTASADCSVLCPPFTPCTASNGLAASTQGGGGSTALRVGGDGSTPGGDGSLLRGGDAMSPCAGVPMHNQAAGTSTRTPSSAPCVGPGGGGGGGLYGGAAGMNGPGGGGSSFVDTGIVLQCVLENDDDGVQQNGYFNDEDLPGEPTDEDYVASNELLQFGDSGLFTDPTDTARQARFFPDACFVETGESNSPGRRFVGIYPAAAHVGVGGVGGRPGGDGLVVLQLSQGAALPTASKTPAETPSRAPRSPVATRSVTSNPSRSAARTRKPIAA